MKKPRILHIFSKYRDFGGEEACFTLFTETLASLAEVEPFIYSTQELFDGNHGAFTKMRYMLHNKDVEHQLRELIARTDFDAWIIHNTFPAMSPVIYQVAMEQHAPIIHYMHNYRPTCLNGVFYRNNAPCFSCKNGHFLPGIIHSCWRNNPVFSALAAATLKKTHRMGTWQKLSAYVAVSNRQRQLLVESGIPAELIRTIPHFITATDVTPANHQGKNVLFSGRLTQEKGVMELIRAWELIAPQDKTLYIMGDGPLRAKLESYIAAHHLNSVCLTGFIPHKEQASIRNTCGLTVIPSLWEETFGMVILESWRHGAPVIVNPIGGLPELITHGENGWISDNTTVQALANALQTAIIHESQWQSMGLKGKQKLDTVFSKETWLTAIRQLFTDLGILPCR